MSNIIKGEGLNEIELVKNTIENTLYLNCKDDYGDVCYVKLSKDMAIELANKILGMCEAKINITGIGINSLPTSKEIDVLFEGYKSYRYFKPENKACENCGCNPKNGGSGNCNCILATTTIY